MKRAQLLPSRSRGFSLVELLIVIALITVLTSLSSLAVRSLRGATSFSRDVGEIAQLMDQARTYAVAQNTYVWVVLYPFTPPDTSASGDSLCLSVYAANDGVDGLDWGVTTSVVTPPSTSPSVVTVFKPRVFSQLRVNVGTGLALDYPGPANLTSLNPTSPNSGDLTFHATLHQSGGQINLPVSNQSYVVQFTPSGAARVNSNTVGWIQMGFQPTKAKNINDSSNLASLWINGLTGLSTVYRK